MCFLIGVGKYSIIFLSVLSPINLLIAQVVDSVLIMSSYDYFPLKNVMVSNTKNNTFEYSNEEGVALIKYESKLDSIKISAPNFNSVSISVIDIKQNSNKVLLFPKEISLKPLFIESEFNSQKSIFIFKPKYRKKYNIEFECSGGIISLYRHEYRNNKKISSISFYLKNISEQKKVQIVLLLYKVNGQVLDNVLEHREIAIINSEMKEINIPLEHLSLWLEAKKNYFIGFQMIDPSKKHNVLISSIKPSKKTKTFFRAPFDDKWIDISNYGKFSIYYEIYFN